VQCQQKKGQALAIQTSASWKDAAHKGFGSAQNTICSCTSIPGIGIPAWPYISLLLPVTDEDGLL
jgi:hypothetical protein